MRHKTRIWGGSVMIVLVAMLLQSLRGSAVATAAVEQTDSRASSAWLDLDGDFESPDRGVGPVQMNPGENIGPWIVAEGNIDHIGTYWEAARGEQSIDLNGCTDGSISRVIDTDAGVEYPIVFAMSGNPDGGASTKEMELGWGAMGSTQRETRKFTFDASLSTKGDMRWTYNTINLLATSDRMVLSFSSLMEGDCYGPVIDDVSMAGESSSGLRFFQFNMCGSEGSAKKEKRNRKCRMNRVAEAVARSIRDFQPTIVTLNEACQSQVKQIEGTLTSEESLSEDDKGPWPMTTEFEATNTTKNRCSDRQFGNAVLVSGSFTRDPNSPYQLPNRQGEGEQRNIVCVITSSQVVPVRACSTHLVNKDTKPKREWNRAQVFKVARLANSWVSDGQVVVIGGDFNNTPEDLSDENTSGVVSAFLQRFSDVDDLERPTHPDGKIDYIFLSTNHFSNITGFPTASEFSDHRPLRGMATLSR